MDFEGDLRCIFSNDNAEQLVLQIRMTNEGDAEQNKEDIVEEDLFLKKIEQNLLNQMRLRGIEGVEKVFMRKETHSGFKRDGSFDEKHDLEWVLDTEGIEVIAYDQYYQY